MYDILDKFFKENEDINPYFEEASKELIADQCYSLDIIYMRTMEKVLESLANEEEANTKTLRYDVNRSYRHVYDCIGESYGIIAVTVNKKAMNLRVNAGDIILYKGRKVAVLTEVDYLADKEPVFMWLR